MSSKVRNQTKTDKWTRWTDPRIVLFLNIIKPFPCLWNPSSPDYKNEEKCNTAYQTVCQEVQVDVDLIKKKIVHYRNIFIRQLAEIKQNPCVAIKVLWYSSALFLSEGISYEELSSVKPLYPLKPKQDPKPKLMYPSLSKKTCRVCLEYNRSGTTPMETENLVALFKECTGFDVLLNIGPYMPTHICNKCKSALMSVKVFLTQCKKTENMLKRIYQCRDRPRATQLFIKLQIEDEENERINHQLKEVEKLENTEFKEELLEVKTEEVAVAGISRDELIKQEENLTFTDDESLPEEKFSVEAMPIIKIKKRKGETGTNAPRKKLEFPMTICPFCGKSIKRIDSHLQVCRMNPEKRHDAADPLQCDLCPKQFTRKRGLQSHKRLIHDNVFPYTCQFCSKKFKHWGERQSHIRCKHMVKKPFECHICNKGFTSRHSIKMHIRTVHTKETPYACKICHVKRSTQRSLTLHMSTHMEKSIYCDVCNKAFSCKKYLKQHYVIHTNEKNYKCPCCEKAYAQNHVLRSHVEKLHPEHQLPPKGTVVSITGIEKLKKQQEEEAAYVKTDLEF